MQKGKKKKHYHLEENILSNAKFLRLTYWKCIADKIQNSFSEPCGERVQLILFKSDRIAKFVSITNSYYLQLFSC